VRAFSQSSSKAGSIAHTLRENLYNISDGASNTVLACNERGFVEPIITYR
jgi:hypothetical protein